MAQSLEDRLKSRLVTAVKQVTEEVSRQSFSGYLVKRLVVEGSFTNVFDGDGAVKGFEVKVKNKLGVATIVGCTPIEIDGEKFGVDVISVEKKGSLYKAAEVSEKMPMSIGFGDEIIIRVDDGQGLESGRHDIEIGLKMVGFGIIMVNYDDTLSGEGRKRVKKVVAETASSGGDFSSIMRSTIELAAKNVDTKTLVESAKIVTGIVLELTDIKEKFSVGINADGSTNFVEGGISGARVLTIRTTRTAFHNMAHNRLNPGIAYARGEIALEGVPILKLRGMDPVITAIFRSYRAASEGLDYEQVSGAHAGGMLEEILGMAFAGFDEMLKVLDGILGGFGVKYFREKSLNRIEFLWEIFDREMKKLLSFGREESPEKTSEEIKKEKVAPADKPAAPAKSLADRLRDRITTVIESAVAEISRTAVSGYLVKRLIVDGSFRNFEDGGEVKGFEVRLKNRLGVATVIGFSEIKIDGEAFSLDLISITKGGGRFAASDISEKRPLSVGFGDEMLVRVEKPGGIAPGKHRVSLGVDMVGLGGVDVDYEEELKS